MHLVLTTFPSQKSRNVGDLLITQSFVELAKTVGAIDDYQTRFRTVSLDAPDLLPFRNNPIFLPGMSIAYSSYPELYSLTRNIGDLPLGLIPFGCTWQHPIGGAGDAARASLSPECHAVFSTIAERTGPIATRDHRVEAILHRQGIPAITVGDCAWFHLASIGKGMRRPTRLGRIAVTTPHASRFTPQSKSLIAMLSRAYPDAHLRLSLHSRVTEHTAEIATYAARTGYEVVESAGRLEVFDEYDQFDLHVGHRLHGHIGFLRRRIPSVLLMEDARSRGFSASLPTGCFAADADEAEAAHEASVAERVSRLKPDLGVIERVEAFVTREVTTGFESYVGVAPFLDDMLNRVALPELRRKIQAAAALLGESRLSVQ